MLAGVAAVGLVAAASVLSLDVALYNGTPSMPVGLYLGSSGSIERGAIATSRVASALMLRADTSRVAALLVQTGSRPDHPAPTIPPRPSRPERVCGMEHGVERDQN